MSSKLHNILVTGCLLAAVLLILSGCTVVMHSDHTELVTEAKVAVEVMNGTL